jgi:hypothetical protein
MQAKTALAPGWGWPKALVLVFSLTGFANVSFNVSLVLV